MRSSKRKLDAPPMLEEKTSFVNSVEGPITRRASGAPLSPTASGSELADPTNVAPSKASMVMVPKAPDAKLPTVWAETSVTGVAKVIVSVVPKRFPRRLLPEVATVPAGNESPVTRVIEVSSMIPPSGDTTIPGIADPGERKPG
jgi:hypothetical protein